MRLKDKVVVITGSTRGIGLAIANACGLLLSAGTALPVNWLINLYILVLVS
ncbi:MAG: hypothetical protein UMV23_00455 [Halanaerobium sp.]|nr:hypothetical protein [Halanaerobium sp.]